MEIAFIIISTVVILLIIALSIANKTCDYCGKIDREVLQFEHTQICNKCFNNKLNK